MTSHDSAPSNAAATKALHELIPFAGHIGITVHTNTPDEVRTSVEFAAALCTAGDILHGGLLMALADTTGAMCALHHLPDGAGTATVESKTNFLRAANSTVTAVSTPLHTGRRFVVVQTDVLRADGKLAVRVTQTQAVLSGQ